MEKTVSKYASSQDWWNAQQLLQRKIIPTLDGDVKIAKIELLVQNHFAITHDKFLSILQKFIDAEELEVSEDGKSVRKY